MGEYGKKNPPEAAPAADPVTPAAERGGAVGSRRRLGGSAIPPPPQAKIPRYSPAVVDIRLTKDSAQMLFLCHHHQMRYHRKEKHPSGRIPGRPAQHYAQDNQRTGNNLGVARHFVQARVPQNIHGLAKRTTKTQGAHDSNHGQNSDDDQDRSDILDQASQLLVEVPECRPGLWIVDVWKGKEQPPDQAFQLR